MTASASATPVFLSRLVLNPDSPQVRRELAEPYEMHRTLMRAFPTVTGDTVQARQKFGVLFRTEDDDTAGRVEVIVQALVRPDWSRLVAGDYLQADADPPNPDCKDITNRLQAIGDGHVLRFRVRANPTKRIAKDTRTGGALDGKRVGLLREGEQLDWLKRKGQTGGFELVTREGDGRDDRVVEAPSVRVSFEGRLSGRKSEGEIRRQMTHVAVRFDGLLRVTDASAFRETLIRGIGPAKAFGFGLLSVAPARP